MQKRRNNAEFQVNKKGVHSCPSNIDLKKFYEIDSTRKIPAEIRVLERYRYELIKNTITLKHSFLLDLGIGSGELLAELTKSGYKGIGFDLSLTRLKQFQNVAKKLGILQICGDITNLSFLDNSYQVIIASELLEHLPNYNKALHEIHRVLKSEGELIVSVPYKGALQEVICPYCFNKFALHGHLHYFNVNILKKALMNQNFSIEYITIVGSKLSRFLFKKKKLPFQILRILDYISLKLDLPGGWLVIRVRK